MRRFGSFSASEYEKSIGTMDMLPFSMQSYLPVIGHLQKFLLLNTRNPGDFKGELLSKGLKNWMLRNNQNPEPYLRA